MTNRDLAKVLYIYMLFTFNFTLLGFITLAYFTVEELFDLIDILRKKYGNSVHRR